MCIVENEAAWQHFKLHPTVANLESSQGWGPILPLPNYI